ncbi:hypothetical protein E2C06_11155 [Dankookia rubra]|uniref:Uncharacterized protein n=1 Tax=Dankookia rubra TaxID=1442381 RepID=A0A4R5QHI8_9PROT|nr:hypothetical protein [Dankookia rubra]TDH62423.1 hypothetical protein E2C06_11155 [Dankookia rubra]
MQDRQNQASGEVPVRTMDGGIFLRGDTVLTPPAGFGWKVLGTGDFGGDWRSDILWRHALTAARGATELQVWTMHGLLVAHPCTLACVPDGWHAA